MTGTNRTPVEMVGRALWGGGEVRSTAETGAPLVEGRDLSSRQTQNVAKDMEIGQPINST